MKAIFVVALLLLFSASVVADSFRRAAPIAPHRHTFLHALPEGFSWVEQNLSPLTVPDNDVRQALREVVDAWNLGNPAPYLAEGFRDRARLNFRIGAELPADARLSLIELVNFVPLHSITGRGPNEQLLQVVNVRARAKTRLEYVDRQGRLKQLDGENDYYLRLFYQLEDGTADK